MFTGIVEGIARVESVLDAAEGRSLTLDVPSRLDDLAVGDSLAINGCCLTVEERDGSRHQFQAGPETLKLTNVGQLVSGSRVNVERALAANGRFGGHVVQGHIDGMGELTTLDRRDDWVYMTFRVGHLANQLVKKGSVAVDGVSLTVAEVDDESFTVMIIPHTLAVTTLGDRQPRDKVNIETDILGKYVGRLVESGALSAYAKGSD